MTKEGSTSHPHSKMYRDVDPWHIEVAEYLAPRISQILEGRVENNPETPLEVRFPDHTSDQDSSHIVIDGTPNQVEAFDAFYRFATRDFDTWKKIREGQSALPPIELLSV